MVRTHSGEPFGVPNPYSDLLWFYSEARETKNDPRETKPDPRETKPDPRETKTDPRETKPGPREMKPDPRERGRLRRRRRCCEHDRAGGCAAPIYLDSEIWDLVLAA